MTFETEVTDFSQNLTKGFVKVRLIQPRHSSFKLRHRLPGRELNSIKIDHRREQKKKWKKIVPFSPIDLTIPNGTASGPHKSVGHDVHCVCEVFWCYIYIYISGQVARPISVDGSAKSAIDLKTSVKFQFSLITI